MGIKRNRAALKLDESLIKELNEKDWVKILRILTAYAAYKMRYKHVPNDRLPQDYAQEAVEKLYFGIRIWNRNKYPELLDFLKRTIDSLINNDTVSLDQSVEKKFIDSTDCDLEASNIPVDILLESEEEANNLVSTIQKEIEGDDILELFFMYLESNYKPREFSTEFNVNIRDVYNCIKKLKRITTKILETTKMSNDGE